MFQTMIRKVALAAVVWMWGASLSPGQGIIIEPPVIPPPYPRPSIPRPRPWPIDYTLEVKSQNYSTEVTDGVAITKVDQTFHNPYPQQIEGTYVFPLADDASVSGFSMFVDGREIKGELLDREQARRVYQDIVSRMRDPALLEYLGSRLYQARIFPIPPNGDVRVKLQYSQTLSIDAGMATLILPLKADARTARPAESTSVVVNIRSQTAIKNVFSPSHAVSVHRPTEREASVSYETSDTRSEEDFVVHYTLGDEAFGLAWLTYREAADDGYFMARIAPPAKIESDRVLPKDVAFVFDTSGSMAGAKIAQAREALKFCLNRLNREDRFAMIAFAHEPRPFREQLIPATAENVEEAVRFVEKLEASGGTNINDALLAALKSPAGGEASRPLMIVFMTDGQPTVGDTEPKRILEHVKDANAARVRLFVFGVGDDVNTQLLDRLAEDNNGARQYVRPSENIEVKVSSFYRKVADPVLSDPAIHWNGLAVRDVFPPKLPDLFAGGEIVIVGRYEGSGSCAIELTGRRGDARERHVYERPVPQRDTQHDFLPRLWATRKIGYLLDEIRLHGENAELKDEVVKLAKRFGIVTPYTAYLVTEDEQLAIRQGRGRRDALPVFDAALNHVNSMDVSAQISGNGPATGAAAVAASESMAKMKSGAPLPDAYAYAPESEGSERAGRRLVSHVGDTTFYFTEGRWIDGRYDGKAETRKIEPFSKAYFDLIAKHPAVAKVLALGERVVFRVDGVWYETIAPREG